MASFSICLACASYFLVIFLSNNTSSNNNNSINSSNNNCKFFVLTLISIRSLVICMIVCFDQPPPSHSPSRQQQHSSRAVAENVGIHVSRPTLFSHIPPYILSPALIPCLVFSFKVVFPSIWKKSFQILFGCLQKDRQYLFKLVHP